MWGRNLEVDEEIQKGYEEVLRVGEQFKDVTFFQGSQEEYERWRGYECEVLAPSFSDEPVYFPESFDGRVGSYMSYNGNQPLTLNEHLSDVKDLCEQGMEAIVNFQSVFKVSYKHGGEMCGKNYRVGLPVRKKRD